MVWLQAALVATALSAPGETVLLDFYADWCGPCRAMEPTIRALVEEGFPVRKINIDREPQLARKFGVSAVPCYVMLAAGQEVDRVVGGTTFSRLKRMWELVPAQRPQTPSTQVPAQFTAGNTRPPVAPAAVESVLPLAAAAPPLAQTPTPDRRPSSHAWTPRAGTDSNLDAALIAASVRLRVEDAEGHSCGSGTIIDARPLGGTSEMSRRWWGQALILTCGHIFRDSQGKGRIEVDLFGPNGAERVVGTLISYDLKRDVGLVSIPVAGPIATARVAPPGYQITPGKPVISVGCNNGDRPTARHSRVTSLDKFLGPPNLEVDGLPVEGRSGGGLFSGDGLVIGVCNAADPTDQEGLYAALASIHTELDQARLSFVYNRGDQRPAAQPAGAVPPPAGLATVGPPPLPKQMPRSSDPLPAGEHPLRPTAASVGSAAPLRLEEQAALDEITQRLREGAEVVFVVTPRDPQAKSDVFILEQASPAFLGQLSAMARRHDPLLSTSLEVPKRPEPAGIAPSVMSAQTPAYAAPAPRRPLPCNWPATTGGWRPSVVEPSRR
jgi:thiol-disulfide isomerase/thioredoxin